MRLNKYIAAATALSRRAADEEIEEGNVHVNGEICSTHGYIVAPNDSVEYKGKKLQLHAFRYYLLNKPVGYICSTTMQSQDDLLAIQLIKTSIPVHSVGRLDKNTSGLLIFTNDGEFTKAITHPSNAIEKEYIATTSTPLNQSLLNEIKKGVIIEGRRVFPRRIKLISSRKIQIVLIDGKKHEVRKLIGTVSKVSTLRRVRIGNLRLESLDPGECRAISKENAYAVFGNHVPTNLSPL